MELALNVFLAIALIVGCILLWGFLAVMAGTGGLGFFISFVVTGVFTFVIWMVIFNEI